jgi:hypothetical protein
MEKRHKKGKIQPGAQFGALTVVKRSDLNIGGRPAYECVCACGGFVRAGLSNLKERIACKSCTSAAKSARMIRHGGARKTAPREQIYELWQSMLQRCANPIRKDYHGKGIKVCDEWKDYVTFRAWVLATRPDGTNLSMDRVDPDGDYCPENIEWVTSGENGRRMMATYRMTRITEEAVKPPNQRLRRYFRHGLTGGYVFPPLYRLHTNMWRRCYSPKSKNFARYGGRGIQICEEWHNFANFSAWAWANGYRIGLTIDRIDSDGDYQPDNCEWITGAENARRMWKNYKLVPIQPPKEPPIALAAALNAVPPPVLV